MLPMSKRPSIPTPAEVDLYRLMGEPLPLLWKSDKLLAWLEDHKGIRRDRSACLHLGDGTRAELILRQQVNKSAYFPDQISRLGPSVLLRHPEPGASLGEVFRNTHNKTAVEDLNRKMVGFILDLGVKRPDANAFNGFMVESPWVHSDAKFNLFGACPRFVSDELWAKRFDIPTSLMTIPGSS